MLYVNENYGLAEASDCTKAILKVERYFARWSSAAGRK